MSGADLLPWKERYRAALRRLNIAFAIAALIMPMAILGFVYCLERLGICISPQFDGTGGTCRIFGWEFSHIISEILVPTAFGIVTLTCLVMSGVGTFLYLVWKMIDK